MRILKLFFSALVFFTIITVVGLFVLREALLFMGGSTVRKSLQTVVLTQNRGAYTTQCQQLGSSALSGERLVTYQLRFLSSTEYVLEAICEGFSFDPILIERKSLPKFVTKVPGTSGFLLTPVSSGIGLQVFVQEIKRASEMLGIDFSFFQREKNIVAQNGIVVEDTELYSLGNGPVTSCVGYGYQCCNDISHVGVGDKINGLVDCEKSCFSSCATRPIILSFNSSPLMDPVTRTSTVRNGDVVEFTYVADAGTADSVAGVLDFGDGKKLPVAGLAAQTSHTYTCQTYQCTYVVSLTLEDSWGVSSAATTVSRITILVTN